jgi:hypothetical protein
MIQETELLEDGTYAVWQGLPNRSLGKYYPDTLVPASHNAGYYIGVFGKSADLTELSLVSQNTILTALIALLWPGQYIGIWTDAETSLVHYDITEHVSDFSKALELARRYNQKAIWDIANNKAIYL